MTSIEHHLIRFSVVAAPALLFLGNALHLGEARLN